jgi:hypothetical protein
MRRKCLLQSFKDRTYGCNVKNSTASLITTCSSNKKISSSMYALGLIHHQTIITLRPKIVVTSMGLVVAMVGLFLTNPSSPWLCLNCN